MPTQEEKGRGSAVQTNGPKKRTKAHLNLTRSLADVWAVKPLSRKEPAYPNRFAAKSRAKAGVE
jgi:hypothetical protein